MVGDVILFTSKLNLFKTKLVSQAYAHSKQIHLSTLSNMVNGLNPGVSKVLCDRPGEDSLWKDSLSEDYPNLDDHTRQTFFNIFDMYI